MTAEIVGNVFPDSITVLLRNGIEVSVYIDGDRDENGDMVSTHTMGITFRKRYEKGFYGEPCIRERRYAIPSDRWNDVNNKYCGGRLEIC